MPVRMSDRCCVRGGTDVARAAARRDGRRRRDRRARRRRGARPHVLDADGPHRAPRPGRPPGQRRRRPRHHRPTRPSLGRRGRAAGLRRDRLRADRHHRRRRRPRRRPGRAPTGPPAGWAGAVPLGLHFEGPMLAPTRRGAHPRHLLAAAVARPRRAVVARGRRPDGHPRARAARRPRGRRAARRPRRRRLRRPHRRHRRPGGSRRGRRRHRASRTSATRCPRCSPASPARSAWPWPGPTWWPASSPTVTTSTPRPCRRSGGRSDPTGSSPSPTPPPRSGWPTARPGWATRTWSSPMAPSGSPTAPSPGRRPRCRLPRGAARDHRLLARRGGGHRHDHARPAGRRPHPRLARPRTPRRPDARRRLRRSSPTSSRPSSAAASCTEGPADGGRPARHGRRRRGCWPPTPSRHWSAPAPTPSSGWPPARRPLPLYHELSGGTGPAPHRRTTRSRSSCSTSTSACPAGHHQSYRATIHREVTDDLGIARDARARTRPRSGRAARGRSSLRGGDRGCRWRRPAGARHRLRRPPRLQRARARRWPRRPASRRSPTGPAPTTPASSARPTRCRGTCSRRAWAPSCAPATCCSSPPARARRRRRGRRRGSALGVLPGVGAAARTRTRRCCSTTPRRPGSSRATYYREVYAGKPPWQEL